MFTFHRSAPLWVNPLAQPSLFRFIVWLSGILTLCFPIAGDAQNSSSSDPAWKPLFRDERAMKKHWGDKIKMEDGWVYMPAGGGAKLVEQPAADAAIRAKFQLKKEGYGLGMYLRSDSKGGTRYLACLAGLDKEALTYRVMEIRWSDGEESGTLQGSSYAFPKPVGLGEILDVEFSAVGKRLTVKLNGETVIAVDDERLKKPGYMGVSSSFGSIFTPPEVRMFESGVAPPPAPVPAQPVPVATGGPMPAASGPQTEADREIEALVSQARSVYDREVGKGHAALVADLDAKYAAALDRALETATKSSLLDDAIALRDEKRRLADRGPMPPQDDAKMPASLKPLRETYRKQIAIIEQQRSAKAAPLVAKLEKALDALVSTYTQQGKLDEAVKIRNAKQRLAADSAWLAAPADAPKEPKEMPPAQNPPSGNARAAPTIGAGDVTGQSWDGPSARYEFKASGEGVATVKKSGATSPFKWKVVGPDKVDLGMWQFTLDQAAGTGIATREGDPKPVKLNRFKP